MYSFQNGIAVEEELQQLNDMFKMLVEIHEELEKIDDQYIDELWFEDTEYIIGWEKWRSRINQEDYPKVAQIQVQSPALPGHEKAHKQKERQVLRSWKLLNWWHKVHSYKKRTEAELQAESLKVKQELAKT